jgi:hypothetical protein
MPGALEMMRLLPAALLLPAAILLAQEDRFFSSTLYPILQEKNCRACHNENGVASGTRLRFPPETATAAQIENFGRSLGLLGELLVNKPTARIAHTGGKLILAGTKEETALTEWYEYLKEHPYAAEEHPAKPQQAAAAKTMLRRLTHSQYNNTVRDLLGDQTLPANLFPQEDFVNGFKNQAEAQSVSPLLAEAYSAAAERLARNAFRGGDANKLIPCKPASAADAACRDQFLRRFGLRAFRRPLSTAEVRRYGALFDQEARSSRDFLKGAQVVVEAMLQAPAFLYRSEPGQYGVASGLSYFLWDTLPDEELFRAAAAGQLGVPDQVEKQARRMLQDPRARKALDEFVSQWMRFDRVVNTVRDRRAYPQYTPELGMAMTEETRRLVHHLVWNNANFMEFYSADYAFLNSELAELYRLPPPPEEFGLVPFPPESDRAGVLGQGTFLTLTSKPEETAPTARGLFIREQFLCQQVPNPPPGVNAVLPPFDENRPQTNRERLLEHLINPSCQNCHQLIDPIGFGLEKFDAIGRRREKQRINFVPTRAERTRPVRSVELPIDSQGRVAGLPDSNFSSPKELGRLLAASRPCQECVVKQVFRYAFGRHETAEDQPLIEQAYESFRKSQFRFQELVISLCRLGISARPAGSEPRSPGSGS